MASRSGLCLPLYLSFFFSIFLSFIYLPPTNASSFSMPHAPCLCISHSIVRVLHANRSMNIKHFFLVGIFGSDRIFSVPFSPKISMNFVHLHLILRVFLFVYKFLWLAVSSTVYDRCIPMELCKRT